MPRPEALPEQENLLPEIPASMRFVGTVPLEIIENTDIIMVPRSFVDSVRAFGVIQPVILRPRNATGVIYTIVDGRRRVATMRLLDRETIPALVIDRNQPNAVARAMTIVANTHRSANPRAEFLAIEDLVTQGYSVSQIAERLHLDTRRIERRFALSRLNSQLLALYRSGQLRHDAAVAALRLTADEQAQVVGRHAAGLSISALDIQAIVNRRVSPQQEAFPDRPFGMSEIPAERPSAVHVEPSPEYVRERTITVGPAQPTPLTTNMREAQDAVQRFMMTRIHYPEGTTIRGRLQRNAQTGEMEYDMAVVVPDRTTSQYEQMMRAVRRLSAPGREAIRERILALLGMTPTPDWASVISHLREAIAAIPLDDAQADAAYHHLTHAYLELVQQVGIVVNEQ